MTNFEPRPARCTSRTNFVEHRTGAVSLFEFIEEHLLHAVMGSVGNACVPEPHCALLPEGVDQVFLSGQVSRKTVGNATRPNVGKG